MGNLKTWCFIFLIYRLQTTKDSLEPTSAYSSPAERLAQSLLSQKKLKQETDISTGTVPAEPVTKTYKAVQLDASPVNQQVVFLTSFLCVSVLVLYSNCARSRLPDSVELSNNQMASNFSHAMAYGHFDELVSWLHSDKYS